MSTHLTATEMVCLENLLLDMEVKYSSQTESAARQMLNQYDKLGRDTSVYQSLFIKIKEKYTLR